MFKGYIVLDTTKPACTKIQKPIIPYIFVFYFFQSIYYDYQNFDNKVR